MGQLGYGAPLLLNAALPVAQFGSASIASRILECSSLSHYRRERRSVRPGSGKDNEVGRSRGSP